jgi:hypothetical protein
MSLQGKWADMPAVITDEMVQEFAVVAPYDQVASAIKERYGGVVDRIGFGAVTRDPEEREAICEIIRQLQA